MRQARSTASSLLVGVSLCLALVMPAAAQDEPASQPAATTLRLALDRILGEHAILSAEVIRTGILGGAEFAAATAVLDANTESLVASIQDIYGADAADAFGQQWRNHIGYLIDYARALDGEDASAAALSEEQLDRYVADFSALLADVIPSLPEATVSGLIEEHVQQLKHIAQFDASEYMQAYPALRETYGHMFMVGDGLAMGIVTRFPDRFPGQSFAFSPATDFRVTLDRLLGEHTYLSALAMRAIVSGSADAASVLDVLGANSAELEAALSDLYGTDAGSAFGDLWIRHIQDYAAYAEALAAGDVTAQETSATALHDYDSGLAGFLAAANPHIAPAELEPLISAHVDQLIAQADEYAAGDYAASYATAAEAYAHAIELSAVMSAAIVAQFPDRLPTTSASGPARAPAPVVVLTVVALVAVAAGVILRVSEARQRVSRARR